MKWIINTRNDTLIKRSQKEGIAFLRVLRICGVHFENSQYKTSAR